MHQPYYKDPETGSYLLPWVRLHAIKDYASLPVIFRGHPGVRHTVNLVPSLLVQVLDYVENGAEDVFLSISRKNALDLTKAENEFLLRNFFSGYAPTMILPQQRYADLFRGHEAALRALEKNNGGPGGYGASEYTDLATLFNLTWFHPLFREEDPELSRLWRKGSGFTEREKHYVLDHQIEVMGRVIDEYRKFSQEDGGELSSSPMYHPILPLLIDNRSALDALPGAALPRLPFSWPADARSQLEQGRGVFHDLFGSYPAGLWPSEGSISPAVLEMAAGTGFRWAATDEILLARAFGTTVRRDPEGIPVEPDWFYRPYAAVTKSGPIPVFFRDHYLSDLIGFEYSRWNARDAANNFIHNLKRIYDRLSSGTSGSSENVYVIPVILDGENAWEYFHDSGTEFLNVLLSKLELLRPNIESITLSEALGEIKEIRELPSTPTGSWIDGTFHIWIGHPEDHAAWEMLSRARTLMESKSKVYTKEGKEDPPDLQKARDYLMVAEGSDWFWWYGDDHYTPHGPEFDRLFRNNIKAAYKAMGGVSPDSVDIPIIKTGEIVQERNVIPAPRSYIQPKIDGLVTSYFEWNSARKVVPSPGFVTMHRAGHLVLSCFYYGFSVDEIFFRFDLDKVAVENVHEIELEILFQEKSVKFNSILDPINGLLSSSFVKIGESGGETSSLQDTSKDFGNVRAAFVKVLELAIPFQSLDCGRDERLEFFVTIRIAESFGERWPVFGTFSAELPGKDFLGRMWHA
ncbi:glycoside hydrolase [Candidatus Deferrimicrobium sp.]|uniref:glycoside hydrolase n=1 Tax=Candidatus Deferrimicrobium sp. TaxID=3060586 RepID=UPI003C6117E1